MLSSCFWKPWSRINLHAWAVSKITKHNAICWGNFTANVHSLKSSPSTEWVVVWQLDLITVSTYRHVCTLQCHAAAVRVDIHKAVGVNIHLLLQFNIYRVHMNVCGLCVYIYWRVMRNLSDGSRWEPRGVCHGDFQLLLLLWILSNDWSNLHQTNPRFTGSMIDSVNRLFRRRKDHHDVRSFSPADPIFTKTILNSRDQSFETIHERKVKPSTSKLHAEVDSIESSTRRWRFYFKTATNKRTDTFNRLAVNFFFSSALTIQKKAGAD